jgi:hypothetical protein
MGQVVPIAQPRNITREIAGSRHVHKSWMPVMGYAMQMNGPSGPIKFGSSIDVLKRQSQIQAHCPYRVEIILIVDRGRAFEAKIKRECGPVHIRGEWYHPHPQVLGWVADKIATGGAYRQHAPRAAYCRNYIAPKILAKHGTENLPWQLLACVEGVSLNKPPKGAVVANYLRENETDILTVEEIAGYQRILEA